MALGIVGLPIPDETILTVSGFFVFQRHLHFIPTIASAFFGSATGITISYLIGKKFGTLAIKKFQPFLHINEEKLDKTKKWFDKSGGWILFAGYFIPVVRHLTAIVAGSMKTKYTSFMGYAYSGCLLWVNTFVTLGYFSGKNWEKIKDNIQDNILLLVIAAVFLAAGYAVIHSLFLHRKKKYPQDE